MIEQIYVKRKETALNLDMYSLWCCLTRVVALKMICSKPIAVLRQAHYGQVRPFCTSHSASQQFSIHVSAEISPFILKWLCNTCQSCIKHPHHGTKAIHPHNKFHSVINVIKAWIYFWRMTCWMLVRKIESLMISWRCFLNGECTEEALRALVCAPCVFWKATNAKCSFLNKAQDATRLD